MSGKITKRNLDSYRVTVRKLAKDEGGGYLADYPDIPVVCRMAIPKRKPSQMAGRRYATALSFSGRADAKDRNRLPEHTQMPIFRPVS